MHNLFNNQINQSSVPSFSRVHRSIVNEKYTYVYTWRRGEKAGDRCVWPVRRSFVASFVALSVGSASESRRFVFLTVHKPENQGTTREIIIKIRNPSKHARVRTHRVPCFTAEIAKTGASHRARRTDERKRTDDERGGENGGR